MAAVLSAASFPSWPALSSSRPPYTGPLDPPSDRIAPLPVVHCSSGNTPGCIDMTFAVLTSKLVPERFSRKRILSAKSASSQGSLDALPTAIATATSQTPTISSPSTSHPPDTRYGLDRLVRDGHFAGRIRPQPPRPNVDHLSPSKARSLDLPRQSNVEIQEVPRASHSTESLMIFLHPAQSRSSTSLSSSITPRTVKSSMLSTASSPPALAKKTLSIVPAQKVRSKPRRQVHTPSYPYFTTPIVFASVNPHCVAAPVQVAPSKGKRKPVSRTEDACAPSGNADSFPFFKLGIRRIRSRGHILHWHHTDDLAHSDAVSNDAAATSTARPSVDACVSLADTCTMSDFPASVTATDDARPPNADSADRGGLLAADAGPSLSAGADEDRRLEIALATVKLSEDVHTQSGIDEVIPKLRRLRVPARLRL
ncbi:uncharacterized protein FIBRA_02845 [Fibroporia radiculosa]|uniref:Uncharacterized protein n=1 Tax=Fibroporia radiculosa TaxID=599839 RepID=J4G304_9APHY|nr:uncharacterized protein FIBRA_02845 [Fibroporia radiculosa]CCM00803.1 predicted protein [Fibroporia radiculosa]